jgi:beta-lactamase superfamily II metal-dependent hydrolase
MAAKKKKPEARTAGATTAPLTVKLVAVGHGDAAIVHWRAPGFDPVTVVIDGGDETSDREALRLALAELEVGRIDLMVLSHTDADHVDGLLEYAKGLRHSPVPVSEYWGPCLPAFRRHEWLFDKRIKRGLDQAQALESELQAKDAKIIYPVEGHLWRTQANDFRIRVLSPPARVLDRLLTRQNSVDLFLQRPMPLGWLIQPDPDDDDDRPTWASEGLAKGFLNASEIGPIPAIRRPRPRAELVAGRDEPDFFGNEVLNDTSIVLLIEADIGLVTRRLLFTGDLENFFYLMHKYPLGLHCDVVKAPHHGSWSFVEKEDRALAEVWQWLRGRAVLVSANGKHNLPRTAFREAATRSGATLFCTCRRTHEYVVGAPPEGSCHAAFGCGRQQQQSVTLSIDGAAIVSDGVACASGLRDGVTPIVQMREQLIEPSAALQRFTDRELEDHVHWVAKELRKLHDERAEAGLVAEDAISATHLESLAAEGRLYAARFNIGLILDRAAYRGRIWVSPPNRHEARAAYIAPNDEEMATIRGVVDRLFLIQLAMPKGWAGAASVNEMLGAADTTGLARAVWAHTGFPADMFHDAIWPAVRKHIKKSGRSFFADTFQRGGAYGPDEAQHRIVCARGANQAVVRAAIERGLPDELISSRGKEPALLPDALGCRLLVTEHGKYRDFTAENCGQVMRYGADRNRAIAALLEHFVPASLQHVPA